MGDFYSFPQLSHTHTPFALELELPQAGSKGQHGRLKCTCMLTPTPQNRLEEEAVLKGLVDPSAPGEGQGGPRDVCNHCVLTKGFINLEITGPWSCGRHSKCLRHGPEDLPDGLGTVLHSQASSGEGSSAWPTWTGSQTPPCQRKSHMLLAGEMHLTL